MPAEPLDSLTEALLVCAVAARRSRPTEELARRELELAGILRTIARVIAVYARDGWRVDDESAGYLIRNIAGVDVWVPWSLAADFPDGEALAELVALAGRVRTNSDATICISGSTAVYESAKPIADLDFSEYLPAGGVPGGALAFSASAALSRDAEDLLWLDLKLRDEPKAKTWRKLKRPASDRERSEFLDLALVRLQGKWTFVARTTVEDVLELTVMVFVMPAAEERSDPYQEASIAPAGTRPRSLTSPASIGRYFDRLRSEVRKAAGEGGDLVALSKAAKRLLGLALLLQIPEIAGGLRQQLASGLAVRAALDARRALADALEQLPTDDRVQALTGSLRARISGLEASAADTGVLGEDGLRRAILAFLKDIEDAYDEVERRLLRK